MAPVSRDTLRKIAATRNSITRISPGRKLNNKWHSLMNFVYPFSLSFLSLSLSTFPLPGWGTVRFTARRGRNPQLLDPWRAYSSLEGRAEKTRRRSGSWKSRKREEATWEERERMGRPLKERSTVSQTEDLEIISLRGRAKLWNSSLVLEPITTSFNERPF